MSDPSAWQVRTHAGNLTEWSRVVDTLRSASQGGLGVTDWARAAA